MAISQYTVGSWGSLRRNRNCLPEIATAPLGPRNDKSGAFTVLTIVCQFRRCSAGSGMPLPYKVRCGRRGATKPTACMALTARKGHAASVRRQSRQRLRSDRRYRLTFGFCHFNGDRYETVVPSRDCTAPSGPRNDNSGGGVVFSPSIRQNRLRV